MCDKFFADDCMHVSNLGYSKVVSNYKKFLLSWSKLHSTAILTAMTYWVKYKLIKTAEWLQNKSIYVGRWWKSDGRENRPQVSSSQYKNYRKWLSWNEKVAYHEEYLIVFSFCKIWKWLKSLSVSVLWLVDKDASSTVPNFVKIFKP